MPPVNVDNIAHSLKCEKTDTERKGKSGYRQPCTKTPIDKGKGEAEIFKTEQATDIQRQTEDEQAFSFSFIRPECSWCKSLRKKVIKSNYRHQYGNLVIFPFIIEYKAKDKDHQIAQPERGKPPL